VEDHAASKSKVDHLARIKAMSFRFVKEQSAIVPAAMNSAEREQRGSKIRAIKRYAYKARIWRFFALDAARDCGAKEIQGCNAYNRRRSFGVHYSF